jgi:predicted permease
MVGAFAVALWANILVWAIGLPLAIDPLPYRDADHIVRVWQTKITSPMDRSNAAYGNVLLWRERSQTAESVGAYAIPPKQLLLESAEPGDFEALRDVAVTEGFFEVLGGEPFLGRLFNDEERRLAHRTLVISHAYWLRRFGGDPGVVGRAIAQAGQSRSVIVGIMPPGFDYPVGTEAWFPGYIPKSWIRDQNSRDMRVIARLKAGVTADVFRQELLRLRSEAAREFPATDVTWAPVVAPIRDELVGDVRPALVSLHVIVALLALLGFANVLTLMLVRADGRRAQHAIQLALGSPAAGPRRQLVVEGLIIAAVGWMVAAIAAQTTVGLVVSWLPSSLPQLDAIGLDTRLLGLSFGVGLGAGIAWGLLTALHIERSGLIDTLALRPRADGLNARSRRRWRQVAVTCEVAIAVVIVAAAFVAATEVMRLHQADPGFTGRQVVAARINVTVARLNEIERTLPARLPKGQSVQSYLLPGVIFAQDLLAQVLAIPSVKLAAVSGTLPLSDPPLTAFVSRADSPAGAAADSRGAVLSAHLVEATEDYFRVLRTPLRSGRFFDERDRIGAEPVAIVSHTLARRLWGEQASVGRLLKHEGQQLPVRVVGVVADIALLRPGDPPVAMLYRPFAQSPSSSMRLLISTDIRAEQLRRALSEAARRLGAHLIDARDLSDLLDRAMAPAGSAARALGMLAFIAVLLAFVGLHATLAATLQFRRRELGIRIAIGASPANVSMLVLKHAFALTAAGIGLGVVAVFVGAKALSAWVPLPPVGATALVVTIIVVLAAAMLASLRPLTRASRLNPAVLIR